MTISFPKIHQVLGSKTIRARASCAKLSCLMLCITALLAVVLAPAARAETLILPPGASAALDKIYSFDTDAAIADVKRLQRERPSHPLGYLLEAEALWWKIWCTSAEFKYGMTDARHRPKLAADQHYQDLVAEALSRAVAQLKTHETAEMQFYAGMSDAFAARLYGLRGESHATARAGVRAREHFLRAATLDPDLSDAEFGLGLYNYYIDTLGAIAKIVGFFMGIPGGNKEEGIRQLEDDIRKGVLTPEAARFYLALDLHRYDQQYVKALEVVGPLVERYPSNPLFQLARGDLYAKLGRKAQALICYHAAAALPVQDAECRTHIQGLVRASLAAQGAADSIASH
jgi:tetratricopeptide (TPR) repeat protein